MTTAIQRYHMENVREYLGRLLALKANLDQIAQEVANDQVREHLEIVRDAQIIMLREARRALDEALAILDQT